ncbi:MAG: FtsX-like permease family protein [Spirosomataceae bacterium]
MLRNYFKIAFRNLWKNKLFSFINIVGLGLAIPFALLALLQLQGAFEFDNFHPNADRVYRIITDEVTQEGGTLKYATSPFLLSDNLKNNYSAVEKSTKVVRDFGWELSNRLKNLKVNTIYVEPSFFELFGFRLANGTIPIEPNSLILSYEAAQRFFGESNPVGKTLVHATYGAFKITGVLKPYKKQTQFRSDVMVSMATYEKLNPEVKDITSWSKLNTHTFVRVPQNTKPEALDLVIEGIAKKNNPTIVAEKKSNHFRKQALADISPSREELRYNPYVDSMQDIYFNFSIPLMILLLAGFNYTNLTLARSLSRSKEVGVRKVMGAIRYQLVLQFICEAVVIALFALAIGMILLALMKQFIHVQWVTWEVENQMLIGVIFVLFTLVLGFVAGILPAWILSNFQPVKVLKGTVLPASFGKVNFRKVLIVIQFVASLGFIFMIGHMYNQFEYMATENENFNRKGIFNLILADKNYQLLVDDISKNKNVERIGLTSMPFGAITAEYAIKANKKDENTACYHYSVDRNFIENMQLQLITGQNLPVSKSDSAGHFVLLNEKAVAKLQLGTPQEAIGKSVFLNNESALQVVGVVKDFCHYNYQYEKQPVVFQYNPAHFALLSIKTNETVSKEAFLAEMQALWKTHYPYQQMVSEWYEQEMYDRYYPAEDMKMMGMASVVIFVIAMMGLLGMVTYSTEKRYKEIGIRKVMGATVWEVVKILSWSFMKLLFIAGAIALPLGFVEGQFFHGVFTYHTSINWGLMGFFFAIVVGSAIFTIAYYATKAALMNPVKSLRNE